MAKYSDSFISALVLSRSGQIGKAADHLIEAAAKPGDEGVVAKTILQFLYATHALRSETAQQKEQLGRVRKLLGDNPVVDLLVADGYKQTAIEMIDERPRAVMVRGQDKQFVRFVQPEADGNVTALKTA